MIQINKINRLKFIIVIFSIIIIDKNLMQLYLSFQINIVLLKIKHNMNWNPHKFLFV